MLVGAAGALALELGVLFLRGWVAELEGRSAIATGVEPRAGEAEGEGKLRVPMRRKVRGVACVAGVGGTGAVTTGLTVLGLEITLAVLGRGGSDLRLGATMVGAKMGSSGTTTSGSNISSSGDGASGGSGAPRKLGTRRAVRGRFAEA